MQEDKAVKLQEIRARVAARIAAKGQSYDRFLTYSEVQSPKRLKVRFDWSKVEFSRDHMLRVRALVDLAISLSKESKLPGYENFRMGFNRAISSAINRANYELTGVYDGQGIEFWEQFWEKKS